MRQAVALEVRFPCNIPIAFYRHGRAGDWDDLDLQGSLTRLLSSTLATQYCRKARGSPRNQLALSCCFLLVSCAARQPHSSERS